MTVRSINHNGDTYALCKTEEDFNEFCKGGGWGDHKDFEKDTGISYKDLLGIPFLVVHGRVYTIDRDKK